MATVAGMAAVVYLGSIFAHEAGGHGGTCLAVGGHVTILGAFYVDCSTHGLAPWAPRLVAAAGSTANLLLAIGGWALFRRMPARLGGPKLFFWLLAAMNGMVWAGYYLFSGVADFGDWSGAPDAVFAGLGDAWTWRAPLIAAGILLYMGVLRLMARSLGGLVGGTAEGRLLGRDVCLTAYAVGGTVAVAIGLLNPAGLAITLGSAAASTLGGTFGFVRAYRLIRLDGRPRQIGVTRGLGWIAAGVGVAVVYAAVLGPSIRFG